MSARNPNASQFHVRLPASSANLGPAFDTAAVALNLHLDVSAAPAIEFAIAASGRNADVCADAETSLILETYRRVLRESRRKIVPLQLEVANEIPLGMGCGSSAAARLAGIALALEFGGLDWPEQKILAYATELEGHPDNAIACWLGGMTVAAVSPRATSDSNQGLRPVTVARFNVSESWSAVLVLPQSPVRTEESRKLLPDRYDRRDVVENLQHCGLLAAAFALGRGDLLRAAMRDRLHQPYRAGACPLLGKLLPLQGEAGILGVALSGAGPGILLIVDRNLDPTVLHCRLQQALGSIADVEILHCGFSAEGVARAGNGSSGGELGCPQFVAVLGSSSNL